MLNVLDTKAPTKNLILLPIAVIVLVALQNNALEYLTEDGYSASVILFGRSTAQLLISSIVGRSLGYSLLPTNWKKQGIRMANSGIAIYLSIISFNYLSATTVSILQRLDIPLLIILSQLMGNQSPDRRTWLSTGAIILVILFALSSKSIDENSWGFATGLGSIVMLSWGVILVKQSAAHENTFVLINVSSISCMLIGFVATFFTNQQGVHFHLEDYGLMIGAGAIQFALNLSAVQLYKLLPSERAQFPAVLGAVSTMLLEMWVEDKFFAPLHIIGVLIITVVVAYIAYSRTTQPQQVRSQDI